jgi:hypothetical protein
MPLSAMCSPSKLRSPTEASERRMSRKKGSGWLNLLLIGSALGALAWLELRRPLRRCVESKLHRQGRNFAVATLP